MRKDARKAPHVVDIAVGANIRRLRRGLRLSQEALGAAVGLTFQQIQKYERGANRVSASMLYEISRALKCDTLELMPRANADVSAGWMGDARALHALHPYLFATLISLPEGSVRLLLASVQAVHGAVTLPEPEAAETSV